MKITMNGLIITSAIVATVGLVGYVLYRKRNQPETISDVYDDKEIQRVSELSIKRVLEWLDLVLDNCDCDDNCELKVNILPNELTIKSFKGQLQIPSKDLRNCYLVLILDKKSEKVIKRKLVITRNVADDLTSVASGKIYEIPIE